MSHIEIWQRKRGEKKKRGKFKTSFGTRAHKWKSGQVEKKRMKKKRRRKEVYTYPCFVWLLKQVFKLCIGNTDGQRFMKLPLVERCLDTVGESAGVVRITAPESGSHLWMAQH